MSVFTFDVWCFLICRSSSISFKTEVLFFFFFLWSLCLSASYLHVCLSFHSLCELHTFGNCSNWSRQQLAPDPPTGHLSFACNFQLLPSYFCANPNQSSADECCCCETDKLSTCSFHCAKIPHNSACAHPGTGTQAFNGLCICTFKSGHFLQHFYSCYG